MRVPGCWDRGDSDLVLRETRECRCWGLEGKSHSWRKSGGQAATVLSPDEGILTRDIDCPFPPADARHKMLE